MGLPGDSMNYRQIILGLVWVVGVFSDSGDGVGELEEGFLFDDINNDTEVDYVGSGDLHREPFRDILAYPVCVTDEDCEDISMDTGADHRCFQYMCYPWAGGRGEQQPFRSCKKRSDCHGLMETEGGDGDDGDCYRHHDRRNVFAGICLHKEEMLPCSEHKDCPTHLRCTNFHCGEPEYYEGLKSEACPVSQDHFCQV